MNDGPAQGDTPARHDALMGAWRVRRTVIDFLAGTRFVFSGQAVVTADAFEETGDIQIGERTLPASRSYRLDRRTDAVAVLRADGSAFISLDGRASQSVRHDCGADLYLGRLLFRGPDEWAEAWRVKGPRKNYASLGRFLRPPAPRCQARNAEVYWRSVSDRKAATPGMAAAPSKRPGPSSANRLPGLNGRWNHPFGGCARPAFPRPCG